MSMILQSIAALAIVWIVVGLWLVINSQSRGWKADTVFVLMWPVHLYLEMLKR